MALWGYVGLKFRVWGFSACVGRRAFKAEAGLSRDLVLRAHPREYVTPAVREPQTKVFGF